MDKKSGVIEISVDAEIPVPLGMLETLTPENYAERYAIDIGVDYANELPTQAHMIHFDDSVIAILQDDGSTLVTAKKRTE